MATSPLNTFMAPHSEVAALWTADGTLGDDNDGGAAERSTFLHDPTLIDIDRLFVQGHAPFSESPSFPPLQSPPDAHPSWTPESSLSSNTGTSSAWSAPPGGGRKVRRMGVSCTACSLRKVKCDRQEKIYARRRSSGDSCSLSDIVCSNCISHGIQCTLREKATAKARTGARLRRLKDKEQDHDAVSSRVSTAETFLEPSEYNYTPPNNTAVGPAHGLLGVPGLTRPILEASIQAFFKWVGPSAFPVRDAEFARSYTAFWDIQEGRYPRNRPAIVEYILALAAAGVSQLEAEDDCYLGPLLDKFEMQRRILVRVVRHIRNQQWRQRDDKDAMEALLAVYTLSFLDAEEGVLDDAEDNCPTKKPMSDATMSALVIQLSLNRAPKLDPRAPAYGPRWRTGRGERLVDDEECALRTRLFFSIYYNDSYRAFSMRHPPALTSDCHDHQEGELFLHSDYARGVIDVPSSITTLSEAKALENLIDLSAVHLGRSVRSYLSAFTSVRSQGLGVPASTALKALQDWRDWYKAHQALLAVDNRIPLDWPRGKAARPSGYNLSALLRCLFFEMLYNAQMLAATTAIQQFGLRHEGDTLDLDLVTAEFEKGVFERLGRVAMISRVCGEMGIVRSMPLIYR